jgi:pimeloyl-ACP methyl ester carboxylesterase
MNVDRYLVRIPVAAHHLLEGELSIPRTAQGIVLFAHGSGSSRHSPRNKLVAHHLNDVEPPLATLLVDLLTPEEEALDVRTAALRFDIGLLAGRLVEITDWLSTNEHTRGLAIGYFGASTGAGAALVAAAERPLVRAVVSRGGRPDLADGALADVHAPTLLIVGGEDHVVSDLNAEAQAAIGAECRLEVIPGATHLFAEPGALIDVARRAARWLQQYLAVSESDQPTMSIP